MTSPRWHLYHLRRGQGFLQFWSEHLNEERRLLIFVGQGFDPRMRLGCEAILRAGGTGQRDCVLLDFDEGPDSPSRRYDALTTRNRDDLLAMFNGRGEVRSHAFPMTDGARRVGWKGAIESVPPPEQLQTYSDLVVDVSALPRSVYFPLIGNLLHWVDEHRAVGALPVNLHVVVAEDAGLDKTIRDSGVDEAALYIHGFSGGLDLEATADRPIVWLPILGEGQHAKLERIHELVSPDEIAPVLPSPSASPRRPDDLLIEYRDLLFDQWRIEPSNVIYASEQNPFEAYRQLHRAVCQYDDALRVLGGCKAAISALSSKLLSVSALLAAYELKAAELNVGIAHVEVQGYEMEDGTQSNGDELFNVWITGECYEA